MSVYAKDLSFVERFVLSSSEVISDDLYHCIILSTLKWCVCVMAAANNGTLLTLKTPEIERVRLEVW